MSPPSAKKIKRQADMREYQEENEEMRREEEQAMKRLLHQGKINGYLASLKGALEIGLSLQSDIKNLKRHHVSVEDVKHIPSNLPMLERLKLSGIRYTNASSDAAIPDELPTSMNKLIRQWQRAIAYKKYDLFLLPESANDVSLVTMLNSTFSSINKELILKELNTNYDLITQRSNNEEEFNIKYVSPFILSLFNMSDKLTVEWDIPVDMYDGAPAIIKRRTPDFTIRTLYNEVVCIGEIKPFNTSESLLEEDRIRLAELSKYYLHKRIMSSRTAQEHHVFGMFCHGESIEIYQHSYEVTPPQNDDFKSCYQFKLLKTFVLPVLPHTYDFMTSSFESLMEFKRMIMSSVCTDRNQPYEFQEYANNFLPTVVPLDEKEVKKLVQ